MTMLRLRTPSRLHFGLLAPFAESGRRYGGVGLMIDHPGIELELEPAPAWSVEGPLAPRATLVLQQLLSAWPDAARRPHRILIRRAAPEHMGLGTGTQLALSLARALAECLDRTPRTASCLASLVGRGTRSALGIHGFEQGGFLVEGGNHADGQVSPLVARLPFPREWPIVLVLPPGQPGLHGEAECRAFARRPETAVDPAGQLSRIAVLELLPALVDRDFAEFSQALFEFNCLAGEAFRDVQGGVYASDQIAEIIHAIRGLGVAGAGQSSWGPGIFAVTRDADQARWLEERILQRFSFENPALLTGLADNRGAILDPS
jgi:beta-RFAP synthase